MVRDKFSITWGDTGTEPPDGDDFQSGERPDAQHFDWKWYHVIDKINAIWDEFTRLDSDDDGIVDEADYANDADASTYKGNDIDTDGDGAVNTADYANDADASTYKLNDIDSDGDGIVDTADYANDADASTYKGNDIDSDGDGAVNTADYANDADASTYKGNDIDSDGDGVVDETDTANNIHNADPRFAYATDQQYGTVSSGDFVPIGLYELADGETLYITQATLIRDPFSTPAPTGLNLIIADETDDATSGPSTTVISGDGTTMYVDETGSAYAKYANTSGSPTYVSIAINNGDFGQTGVGSETNAYAGFIARIN